MAILSSVTNRIVSIYIIIEFLNWFLFSQYHALLHSFLEQHLVTLNTVYIKVQFYSKHLLFLMKRWYITFVCGPPWLKTKCWGVLVGRPPPEALVYKSHFCTVVLQYSIFTELKWTFEENVSIYVLRVLVCILVYRGPAATERSVVEQTKPSFSTTGGTHKVLGATERCHCRSPWWGDATRCIFEHAVQLSWLQVQSCHIWMFSSKYSNILSVPLSVLCVFYCNCSSVCVYWLDIDLGQLLTMEVKEFSDGEMTIALTSATTDKEVHFNHEKDEMLDSILFHM